MGIYYGLNSDNYSSFFTSSVANKSSNMGLYGSLGDYGLIRTGSYKKLCKAYYKQEASDDKGVKNNKTDASVNKEAANDAVAVKKSVNELSKMEFSEANSSKVASAVTNFVKSYNNMLSSADDSESATISNATKNLASYTKANVKLLNQVGISVDTDSKLSVDSKALESAKMSDLKNLFQGNSSFAGRVSSYASSIYVTAVASDSSLYSSSGSIQTVNTSSLFNAYL